MGRRVGVAITVGLLQNRWTDWDVVWDAMRTQVGTKKHAPGTTAAWRILLNRPCAAAMRPFCEITLSTCYLLRQRGWESGTRCVSEFTGLSARLRTTDQRPLSTTATSGHCRLHTATTVSVTCLLTYLLTCLLTHNQEHVRQTQRHITETTADTGTGLKANILVDPMDLLTSRWADMRQKELSKWPSAHVVCFACQN